MLCTKFVLLVLKMSFTNPPLSGSDIKRRLHGKTRVILYEELSKYKDIDELL